MTIAAVEEDEDPYLLPLPGPNTPVIADHLIVGVSVRGNARYSDDYWPLDLLTANPSASGGSITWSTWPAAFQDEMRLAAWNMINGQLRPTFVLNKSRRLLRPRVSLDRLKNTLWAWRRLATWLSDEGISSLAGCGTEVLDIYARYFVDAGASRSDAEKMLVALTRLWAFDQLSAAPSGIGKPRWEDVGVDDYLPPASTTGGENSTEPLSEATMGPLLVWAMRVVDDFADDILTGWAEGQRLTHASATNRATEQSQKALEAFLGPLIEAALPIPTCMMHGRVTVARTYIAGLTGASEGQVDRFMARFGGMRGVLHTTLTWLAPVRCRHRSRASWAADPGAATSTSTMRRKRCGTWAPRRSSSSPT